MKSFFLFLIFLSSSNSAFNQSYPHFSATDSIASVIFDDYQKGKELLESLEKKYKIEPSMEIIFVFQSLRNDDLNFFKKRIKKLVVRHGCNWFTTIAFQKRTKVIPMLELAEEKKVDKWLMINSDKWIKKWTKNNLLTNEIRLEIEKLVVKDQQLIKDYMPLINSDTLSRELKNLLSEKMQQEGKIIINDVVKLCQLNGGVLPNSFDNGVGIIGQISMFIGHNSEISEENFVYTWGLMTKYIEDAVLQEKIGSDLLLLHDQYSFQWFGYQKYGYLGSEIPVKE